MVFTTSIVHAITGIYCIYRIYQVVNYDKIRREHSVPVVIVQYLLVSNFIVGTADLSCCVTA